MRILPWIGAAVFFLIGQVVMSAYGTTGGVIVLIPALGLWWWAHIIKEKKMDQLYSELMKLDHEKRTEVIADLSPEDRDDILKRRARDLRPNQLPETTRGK